MKRRVLQLFKIIKNANAELKKIRDKCPHKRTHEGLYGMDVAHAMNSTICSDCGYCLGPCWTGGSADAVHTDPGCWVQSNIEVKTDPKKGDWFERPE